MTKNKNTVGEIKHQRNERNMTNYLLKIHDCNVQAKEICDIRAN